MIVAAINVIQITKSDFLFGNFSGKQERRKVSERAMEPLFQYPSGMHMPFRTCHHDMICEHSCLLRDLRWYPTKSAVIFRLVRFFPG